MENTQVKLNTEWDLAKYFYSDPFSYEITQDIESSIVAAHTFASKYKDKINTLSEDEFLEYMNYSDFLFERAHKVYMYLGFMQSTDLQDTAISKKISTLDKMFSDVSELLLFVNEEYKKIGYEKFMQLAGNPKFNDFKNYLTQQANNIKYLLSDKEERVYLKLNNANSDNLYDEYNSCFEFKCNDKILSEDEVRALRESQDRDERKRAFESIAEIYKDKKNQIAIGSMYSLVCKNDIADLELRGYKNVMSERNLGEEVSDEAVDMLINEVKKNYHLYHRYLKIKAKFLGIDKLETHDIFAPFPKAGETEKYDFEKGWNLYMDIISRVDKRLYDFSNDMVNGSRMSVYPKPNKVGGAYASYGKNMNSFVLLNWADTFSDVTTLAHELGHAFHGQLSQSQKNSAYGTPMTLAETASIFNETLMFENMIPTVSDDEKKVLISSRLDDIFGTIFRQIAYTMFEKRCHESFLANNPLTYKEYNQIWLEEMNEMYGSYVNVDPELVKYTWAAIPHFQHTPFYCYSYAFGNIISLNIYQTYKDSDNKEDFIVKYHSLLEAGGSDTPENLINNIFGIKFDSKFYDVAFKHVSDLLDMLEK